MFQYGEPIIQYFPCQYLLLEALRFFDERHNFFVLSVEKRFLPCKLFNDNVNRYNIYFNLRSGVTFFPVRVKGGMSLRNGMWHGVRNGIIMRNTIYAGNKLTEKRVMFSRQFY